MSMEIKLWELRRFTIAKYIEKYGVTSIADFGCGDGKLITYLIQYFSNHNSINLKYLLGTDLLNSECNNLSTNIQTIITEHKSSIRNLVSFKLKQTRKWKEPTHLKFPLVEIFNHDIIKINSSFKSILISNKVKMITMVEVIEHLFPNQITTLFQNLMQFYGIEMIIMTTPNKEYNSKYGLKEFQFRHWDHKFEWTRKEFETICKQEAEIYGYEFSFNGIGEYEQVLGHPTQMVFFTKIEKNKYLLNYVDDIDQIKITSKYLFNLNKIIYEREDKKIRIIKFINEIYDIVMTLQNKYYTDICESVEGIEIDGRTESKINLDDVFSFYKVKSTFKNISNFINFLEKTKRLLKRKRIVYNFKDKYFSV